MLMLTFIHSGIRISDPELVLQECFLTGVEYFMNWCNRHAGPSGNTRPALEVKACRAGAATKGWLSFWLSYADTEPLAERLAEQLALSL